MTTLFEDDNPYAIRIEAVKRVRKQDEVSGVLQGEAATCLITPRILHMEAAIKKEIADAKQQREKTIKENSSIYQDAIADNEPPPEGGSLVPTRIATREEQQNMILAIDKNYRFLFEQLAGLNNALDVIQEEQKALSDRLKVLEDANKKQ